MSLRIEQSVNIARPLRVDMEVGLAAIERTVSVKDYSELTGRPIIKVETLPDPENSIVEEDTLYQVGDRFYMYKTGNLADESGFVEKHFVTDDEKKQLTKQDAKIDILQQDVTNIQQELGNIGTILDELNGEVI